MQAEEFVREARSTQPELPPLHLLQLVACQEEPLPHTEESSDQHALFRALVLEELQKTLSSGDRALIRFCLKQEMICYKNNFRVTEECLGFDSFRLCGFLLFVLAQVEDVPLLWEAKTTNFDTMCGFDIQFLVGAGVSPTLDSLRAIQEEWAQDARAYIEKCQRAGDFDDLDRYRHEMQRYFA
jgi:hypothetical protein